MAVDNTAIAGALTEVANLLSLQGANPHRVQAYRTAAQVIKGMPPSFAVDAAAGHVQAGRGLGKQMRDKIGQLARTGTCDRLDELRRQVPPASRLLLGVPGLGPNRARRLSEELSLRSLHELRIACQRHRVRELAGFGAKTEANILAAIVNGHAKKSRIARTDAIPVVRALTRYLRRIEGVAHVVVAGSYRRGQETIGDIDMLVAARAPRPVVDAFVAYRGFSRVGMRGAVRATAFVGSNLQVDLRVVPPTSYGAALIYFTGSKAHNIELRRIARALKLKLNEYGVFMGRRRLAGSTERSIYRALRLPYVPPRRRITPGAVHTMLNGKRS